MDDRLCLALDVDDFSAALSLVDEVKQYVGLFKIGLQLFQKDGPNVVEGLKKAGVKIFLDLKFHDIPNTVGEVSRLVTSLGVSIFNLHASGGPEMIESAVRESTKAAAELKIERPKILAVTVLTSIDERILTEKLKVSIPLNEYVVSLAVMSKEAGADGVICSPKEIEPIRKVCGKNFIIGAPGIRPPGSPPDDQKRFLTPREAIQAGANFIVVGRPIRNAVDPKEAARDILYNLIL
jgi:orotidine-5'-phosphate decarboxylase